MNHLADETTVHGVKDIWYAGWWGRIFWLTALAVSLILMSLQLEGLFRQYIDGTVGTRVTQTLQQDTVDEPSIYYCNHHWMPTPEAFRQLMDCTYPYNETEQQYTIVGWRHFIFKCGIPFIRERVKEELLNAILDNSYRSAGEEAYVGVLTEFEPVELFHILFEQLISDVDRLYNGSLTKFITTLAISGGHPLNGVLGSQQDDIDRKTQADGLDAALRSRSGVLAITNRGVCWELRPQTAKTAIAYTKERIIQHRILHYGGYGYGLQHYAKRWGYGMAPDGRYFLTQKWPVPGVAYKNYNFVTSLYVGDQQYRLLPKAGEVTLTAQRPVAHVKISTKISLQKHRRNRPCKSDWTPLDQLHCEINAQRTSSANVSDNCLPYLPASLHYTESHISNRTCIGKLGNSLVTLKVKLEEINRSAESTHLGRMMNIPPAAVKDSRCPPPCTLRTYRYEISYPSPTREDELSCRMLVGAQLMSAEAMRNGTAKYPPGWDMEHGLHCSLVDVQQTEADGVIMEEYFLMTLPSIASNVGGTVGLYISSFGGSDCLHLLHEEVLQKKGHSVSARNCVADVTDAVCPPMLCQFFIFQCTNITYIRAYHNLS